MAPDLQNGSGVSTARRVGRWGRRTALRAWRAVARDKAAANAALNRREVWQGRIRLHSFPRGVQVGTNWTCNLSCPFCIRQTAEKERIAALAADEREIPGPVMDRLLAILPCVQEFSLTPLGEPLLWSGLDDFLQRYRATGARNLRLTTNGALMSEARARSLVEAGTRKILISMESADPEMYASLRRGARLEQISEALLRLAEHKRRLSTPWPRVILAATFMRRNIEHLPGLVAFAEEHGAEAISVQLMDPDNPEFEDEMLHRHPVITREALRRAGEEAMGRGVRLDLHPALERMLSSDRDTPEPGEPEPPDAPSRIAGLSPEAVSLIDRCDYPWTSLMVDTNGDARPCCWAAMRYGNLANQSFDEVWNGPAARALRENFLKGVVPAACHNKHCRVETEIG